MKKIAALATVLLVSLIIGFNTAAVARDKHPVYQTPKCVDAQVFETAQVSVSWCDVPYADFYTVRVSKTKDMKNPFYVSETAPGEVGTVLNGLELGTRYYATVRVTTSRNEALSDESKRIHFCTPPTVPAGERS